MYLELPTNTMKKGERMKKLIIAVALTVGVQNIAHADLQNMGFEDGNLTNWTLTPALDAMGYPAGSVAATQEYTFAATDLTVTLSPYTGTHYAQLNAGALDSSDVQVDTQLTSSLFNASTNQIISGAAAFIAADASSKDGAYVKLFSEADKTTIFLWQASSDHSLNGGIYYTGWETWSYSIQSAGDYRLIYGVYNAEGNNYDNSSALFDAVPAPNTLLLLGSGLLGLVGIRRKLQ